MIQAFKNATRLLMYGLMMPLAALVWIVRLLGIFRSFVGADHVLVPHAARDFGHTIVGPDTMRRLWQGKRLVFVLCFDPDNHNRRVEDIWPDISVHLVPRFNLDFRIFGKHLILPPREWHDSMAGFLTRCLVRIISPRAMITDLNQLYDLLPAPRTKRISQMVRDGTLGSVAEENGWPRETRAFAFFGLYVNLVKTCPAAPIQLPSRESEDIRSRLISISGQPKKEHRICGLWQRFDLRDDAWRNGTELNDCLPAIEVLNRRGYQVLLTGDRPLPKDVYEAHAGMLVDAANIGLERDAFRIFGATEVDIFIGDSGAGSWLSVVNDLPRLIVNAYPLNIGHGGWVYYKTIGAKSGEILDFENLLTKFPTANLPDDWYTSQNSATELKEAISEFLEIVDSGAADNLFPELSLIMPRHCPFILSDSKLLTAWVRKHIPKYAHASEQVRAATAKQT